MSGSRILAATLIQMALLWPVTTNAQPTVGYVGFLADDEGPVDYAVDIDVALFADETASRDEAALWTETHQDVVVENGRFFLSLGSESLLDTSDFESAELWLKFTIDDVAMAERVQLDYVPYSFLSSLAEDSLALARAHPETGNTLI